MYINGIYMDFIWGVLMSEFEGVLQRINGQGRSGREGGISAPLSIHHYTSLNSVQDFFFHFFPIFFQVLKRKQKLESCTTRTFSEVGSLGITRSPLRFAPRYKRRDLSHICEVADERFRLQIH